MSDNNSDFEDFEREKDPLRRESRPIRLSWERESQTPLPIHGSQCDLNEDDETPRHLSHDDE